MKLRYIAYALLSPLLFAASTPISKTLLKDTNPVFLAGLFYLGASVLLLPFSYKNFKTDTVYLIKNKADLKKMIATTVFGGIAGPLFLLFGISIINASSASLLLNLETAFTSILAVIFFKEHLTKLSLASVLATIIGGTMLVINSDFQFSLGGILIALACICWGLDNNFTATIEGISSRSCTIIKGFVSGVFNLCLAYFLYGLDYNPLLILIAIITGFFAYGLSIALYIKASRLLGATRSQIIFSAHPFLGVILSVLFLGEKLNFTFYLASMFMLTAILLLNFEKHAHRHFHKAIVHKHEHTHNDSHHDHKHDGKPEKRHSHEHEHTAIEHSHKHLPDIHHRHSH